MNTRRLLAAICMLAVSAQPMKAQGTKDPPAAAPRPPVQGATPGAPTDAALPPYEPQLDRLAELMGALTYLRDLCGKGDAPEWRARMSALLEAEATTVPRKERLAGAYNHGFRAYETTYQKCTPSAELVILRFLDEGDRLAKDLSARFGGG